MCHQKNIWRLSQPHRLTKSLQINQVPTKDTPSQHHPSPLLHSSSKIQRCLHNPRIHVSRSLHSHPQRSPPLNPQTLHLLSNRQRTTISPLRTTTPSRSQTLQHPSKLKLLSQNLRFWISTLNSHWYHQSINNNDLKYSHKMVQSTWNTTLLK